MNPGGAPAGRPPGAAVPVAGVVVTGWLWLTAHLARWTVSGRWPGDGLGSTLASVARLPGHWSDPARAWPVGAGPVAPPAVFYGWAGCLLAVAIAAGVGGRRRWAGGSGRDRWGTGGCGPGRCRPGRRGAGRVVGRLQGAGRPGPGGSTQNRGRGAGGGWARRVDLRPLRVRRSGRAGRVVLGRISGRAGLLATEARHSVLVIGPTQSGKTTGLAIPALLEWDGPVIATSVKDDLAAATIGWRSRLGPVAVFDPTATSGLSPIGRWSPLSVAATWSDAQRTAGWLVEATPGRSGLADAAFWYRAAAKQLAPLLLAAAGAGMTMADVVRWTDAGDFDEPAALLRLAGEDDAAVALAACAGRDERIRSSVGTTLETVLAPMLDPVVAAATAATDFDLARLLGSAGSLYLCGPSHEQSRVQGLFATLVSAVIAEALARVAATGRPLDPPLLVVLDEAANIAPLRDLDTIASTAAGVGIQLVTVCQDLAQLAARYDPERARTIANNHRAKLVLSGVCDLGTLDLISGLAGEIAVKEDSTTYDLRDGRRTRTTATVLRRLAPADELRRVPPGHGVLVYGHLPPVRLQLRPWYHDRRLRARVEQPGAGPGAERREGD